MAERKAVTPEEIIDLIVAEMDAQQAPSRFSILVRNAFHVRLEETQFERLKPVQNRIRTEAVRALNEELARRNKGSRSFRIPGIDPPADQRRWETLADWHIDFSINTDDDALDAPLIVHADFHTVEEGDDRLGDRTERVSRRAADGTVSTTTAPASAQSTGRKAGSAVLARLEYEDDRGPGVFEMTTRQIKIGRGGENYYVDLKLTGPKDISRVHLVIRRDDSGAFVAEDRSTLGTTINKQRIPEGGVAPLPDRATIVLAEKLKLRFRIERA